MIEETTPSTAPADGGGLNRMPESQLAPLLEGIGRAIDVAGGSFTMDYAAMVLTTTRVE